MCRSGNATLGAVPARDDAELVRGIAAGDHHAFLELHDRFQARCVTVARRVLTRDDGVADVLQEVFLDLWRRSARYDSSKGSVAVWLLSVTHHRAVDYVRREQGQRNRAQRAWQLAGPTQADLDPATVVLRTADQRRVLAALTALAPNQRAVLVLAYFGGLTQTQIADRMGAPLGTVKTRARDGLRHLRKALETS
jgi:RNA polymerase sigma-70 factor (ECF subfamily)